MKTLIATILLTLAFSSPVFAYDDYYENQQELYRQQQQMLYQQQQVLEQQRNIEWDLRQMRNEQERQNAIERIKRGY